MYRHLKIILLLRQFHVKDYYFIVSGGTVEQQCESDVTIYNKERPSGNWIVVKGGYFWFITRYGRTLTLRTGTD